MKTSPSQNCIFSGSASDICRRGLRFAPVTGRCVPEPPWWMLKRKLKRRKRASRSIYVWYHNTAGFQTPLCTSTIPSPEESRSPSEKGMKLQLSAFLASPNARVKDTRRRWRALTAEWRRRLSFHRDGVEVRLRCVTLTPATCDPVKLPEAPARQILIRSQLPPMCTT